MLLSCKSTHEMGLIEWVIYISPRLAKSYHLFSHRTRYVINSYLHSLHRHRDHNVPARVGNKLPSKDGSLLHLRFNSYRSLLPS